MAFRRCQAAIFWDGAGLPFHHGEHRVAMTWAGRGATPGNPAVRRRQSAWVAAAARGCVGAGLGLAQCGGGARTASRVAWWWPSWKPKGLVQLPPQRPVWPKGKA